MISFLFVCFVFVLFCFCFLFCFVFVFVLFLLLFLFLFCFCFCFVLFFVFCLFSLKHWQVKCFYYPVLEIGGGKKYSRYHHAPAPFWLPNIYAITIMYMVHIQYHQRKIYGKDVPSEYGRVLKYILREGKNGWSILPRKRCRKPAAITKAQPKYFTNHTTKGTINTLQNGLPWLQ